MSLLMDALKKAELAKRKTEARNVSAAASRDSPLQSLLLSPDEGGTAEAPPAHEHADSASSPLPSLTDRMELLDREFSLDDEEETPGGRSVALASDTAPDIGTPAPLGSELPRKPAAKLADADTDGAGRDVVRNLFEAKQPKASRKSFGIAVGATTLIAATAIGVYFWYQLQPQAGLVVAAPPPNSDPARATSNQSPELQAAVLEYPPDREADTEAKPVPVQKNIEMPPGAASSGIATRKKLFEINKAPQQRIDPALERGYAALNHGDNASAKAAYEQALINDPRNVDALAGLAVLAENSGNFEQAADLYQRILDADPHHAFALAGLISLQSHLNPSQAETRLKQAISAQPDAPALNFALGNLYAATQRWPEAQQAYFAAVAADPGNPDYLFNLAVSLDQMRQPKLASNYYAQAVVASANRPASFDRAKANERIAKLQQ